MSICPACGTAETTAGHQCAHCGFELAGDDARRDVTVVFSDLKGSTSLGETLDAESLRSVLGSYFDVMRTVFEGRGGTIHKIIGDAIVAVFGLSGTGDDDAARAVLAVKEAEAALETLNDLLEPRWGIRLVNRTGVATGPVVVGREESGSRVLSGATMEIAETLEAAAPGLGALIADTTHVQVRGLATVSSHDDVPRKGGAGSIVAFRLLDVDADAVAATTVAPAGAGDAAPTRPKETRRTVTIVFADPKPDWDDAAAATPEAIEAIMTAYFAEMRPILERHGGTVEKFIGDALMAVFGLTQRHEDDAVRAARAAFEMQQALPRLNDRLHALAGARLLHPVGVNTGEVVAGDAARGERLVTGDAVNVAARLEQNAGPGNILLGALTERLARDGITTEAVAPLTLKGKSEPVPAFRLTGLVRGRAAARRAETPMVGRDDELARLHAAFADAGAAKGCRVVTVVGGAGVGKTRLTREFLDAMGEEATILRGRCLPYGDGITFWPVVEVLSEGAGIEDTDTPETARAKIALLAGDADVAARLTSIAGLSAEQFQVAELFWAVRRLVETLGRDRPVVLHFDDVHWAEETFLDLVDHLEESTSGAAVLALCSARPELHEEFPAWADRDHVRLHPLTESDAAQVVGNLLGDAGIDERVRDRVVAAAAGNPLFVEQLMSMLIDEGRLTSVGGRWVAAGDLDALDIPPSIHALLAARLDRLPEDERNVVEPASVIGQQFPTGALAVLVEDALRDRLGTHLDSLTIRQLIERVEDDVDDLHRFEHLLVKDAAYQGLLKQSRAELHERFVSWADVVNRERGREAEFEEILGYHLEQAHRYWSELGPLDEHAVAVGADASRRLASAGMRAFARSDMSAAANLLTRATRLLEETDPGLPPLYLRLGEARLQLGTFGEAEQAYEVALKGAMALSDAATVASARVELLRLGYLTDSGVTTDEIESEVDDLLRRLEGLGDDLGIARAWQLIGNIKMAQMRWTEIAEAAREVVEHARKAGDGPMEIRALPPLATAALYGPTPVDEAATLCEELLTRAQGNRRAEVLTRLALAQLKAMQGEFDGARAIYRRARRTLDELGWSFQAAVVSLDSGPIELLAGDPAAAERELRRDYEALHEMGETNVIATTAALLADTLCQLDRQDEALEMAEFALKTAAEDDVAPQNWARLVEAKILATEGRYEEAEQLATVAVELTMQSDDQLDQANALVALATVVARAGRSDEARSLLEDAVSKFDKKGNVVAVTKTRDLAAELLGSPL